MGLNNIDKLIEPQKGQDYKGYGECYAERVECKPRNLET